MFLVRIMTGRKARAYRLDPFMLANNPVNDIPFVAVTQTRRAQAWWIQPLPSRKVIGIAAIGPSIEECHRLIDRLRTSREFPQRERQDA